jgi:hypothetical protein
LAEVLTPKKEVNRASTLDTDYWGLICEAQEMMDAKIKPIDVSSNKKDNEVKEIGKQMDI